MNPRVAALRARLAAEQLDGVLVTSLTDVQYLSGLHASNAAVLVTPATSLLFTDFRYRTAAANQAPDWAVSEQPSGVSLADHLVAQLKDLGLGRLGFQSDQLTHASWAKLTEKLAEHVGELVATTGLVSKLREVKDDGELAAIRRAAVVADETMRYAWETARPGVSERALRAKLDYYMVTHGASQPSFDMIVASGPHSALPHAEVSDRCLADGDLLTIDLGAVVDGYCSDLTRTVAVGSCQPAQEELYDLVWRAHAAGLAAVRPGVKGKDVDEAARAVIRDAGHAERFGHGLGHGVGLEIHEGPRLSVTGETELVAGQVVTVEPGVYLPDFAGVRIEDLVVVTADGCELLSHVDRPAKLMVIGA